MSLSVSPVFPLKISGPSHKLIGIDITSTIINIRPVENEMNIYQKGSRYQWAQILRKPRGIPVHVWIYDSEQKKWQISGLFYCL